MRPLSHKSVLTLALGGVLAVSSIYVALADDDADDDAAEYPKTASASPYPIDCPLLSMPPTIKNAAPVISRINPNCYRELLGRSF